MSDRGGIAAMIGFAIALLCIVHEIERPNNVPVKYCWMMAPEPSVGDERDSNAIVNCDDKARIADYEKFGFKLD
jgi:hypothetical protein